MTAAHRYIYVLFLWLLTASWGLAQNQSIPLDKTLLEAIETYRTAMNSVSRDERLRLFQRAELLFARLVTGPQGIQNPSLYTNLGNAALQAEHLGTAVLSYRRALHIDPSQQQARQNLEHARSRLPDWIPNVTAPKQFDTFFVGLNFISLQKRRLLAATMFFVACALLAFSMRWQHSLLRNTASLLLVFWAVLLAATFWQHFRPPVSAAVVTRPETIARAADATNAPPRFSEPLPGGTEVHVELQRDGWAHIRLADGRDGWVRLSDLGFVCDLPVEPSVP